MKRTLRHIALLSLLGFLFFAKAANAQTITCNTGTFGTVSTQATLTSPNNIVMDTAGSITYPGTMSGPATGTPITCTLSGWRAGRSFDVDCDAARTITNSAGCCGVADRNITAITVKGVSATTAGPTVCNGLAGGTTISFTSNGAGTGTLTFGLTMDATHAKIGSSYALSNNAAGPLNITVHMKGGGPQIDVSQTANFTAVFSSLVAFTSVTNLSFGNLAFSTQPGASDHVDLGTDGTEVFAGVFSAQSGGSVAAGQVTVNNVENGMTLEVYCDNQATLSNGSGKTIKATGLKVAAEGSTGTYAGAGSACNGASGAVATTMVYTSGTRDQFFFGGKLDGGTASASLPGGSYSTANSGGVYANVVVLNQ